MALALDIRRPAGTALRTLLQREFVRAGKRLDQATADSPSERVKGVHEFRRSVKRLRAALRLARGVIGAQAHRVLDRALGGAARRLGTLRDAHARTIAAGRIAALLPRSTRAVAMDAWRATGGAVAEAAGGMSVEAVRALVRESRAEIDAAQAQVAGLDLDALTWSAVARAIAESHGAARARFRARWDGRDEEWLHDARKRAQRAANMLALLPISAGRPLDSVQVRLRQAAGLLGESRDAGLMLDRLPELPKASPLHAASRQMRRAAARHRTRCLSRARAVGLAASRERRDEMRLRLDRALRRPS